MSDDECGERRKTPIDLRDPEQVELLKGLLEGAIDSWLDKQYAKFGKWTLRGMGATGIAWLAYIYFSSPHPFKP